MTRYECKQDFACLHAYVLFLVFGGAFQQNLAGFENITFIAADNQRESSQTNLELDGTACRVKSCMHTTLILTPESMTHHPQAAATRSAP